MWRSDPRVTGPSPIAPGDITAVNRLFAEAFTDRYRRDGLHGVRVPFLNPAVWRFALANAGEGALCWRDGRGDIVAFNLAHLSGREGWMGPLAVRPDRQGSGLGGTIVSAGVAWLKQQGAATIGLETMPRTVDNIGFYSRLGFVPGPLTISLRGDARAAPRQGYRTFSRDGDTLAADCAALTEAVAPGRDYGREMALTRDLSLGGVVAVGVGRALQAFALWHAVPLAQSRGQEELRILKLVARDVPAALEVLAAAAAEADLLRLPHVVLRCQADQATLYAALIREGWRVQWTDLRMTLEGFPELATAGVVMSNWEI
jgi:GNAT superfamily N-acetyltransferase